jgi:hypothetical protein
MAFIIVEGNYAVRQSVVPNISSFDCPNYSLLVHLAYLLYRDKVFYLFKYLFNFDLTYYHKQCIDGMDEIRREAWGLYKYGDWSQGIHLTVKEKIATLKLLKECNEVKFALLERGPSVLNVKGMEEKLENIQSKQISQ